MMVILLKTTKITDFVFENLEINDEHSVCFNNDVAASNSRIIAFRRVDPITNILK